MSYHLDPTTKEPVYCRCGGRTCPVAPRSDHYGCISEAVAARDEKLIAPAA